MRRIRILSFALAMALMFARSAEAATISYGNFPVPPSGITFQDVTESSGTDAVPLFGPPHTFQVGMDFDPKGFIAAGANGVIDQTDAQLNFTAKGSVVQSGGVGINSFTLTESGDYSLLGVGTTATKALAGVSMKAKVTEIDGTPVAPIELTGINPSVGFNLIANGGLLQPWSLSKTLQIASQLTTLGIPFTIGATKVEVVIDNSLNAISESASSSFIAKKDFVISVDPDLSGVLPEPGSMLAGLAICGLAARRRACA